MRSRVNRWKMKMPILIMILVICCTGLSLSTYQAPTSAASDSAQTEDAAKPDLDLLDKVAPPVREAMEPAGSKTVKKMNDENQTYRDGTYYGTATGFRGTIKVQVIIKEGKISSIKVISFSDDSPYFDRAKSLLGIIVAKQTTNVDTVSGATYSSAGLINAVRDALNKALVKEKDGKKNKEEKMKQPKPKPPVIPPAPPADPGETGQFPYPDGTYYGTGTGYQSDIIVSVTIKAHSISKIKVISHADDETYFNAARSLLDNIVTAQRTDIDAVSGATYSSRGLLEAVKNALQQAKAAADALEEQSGTSDEEDQEDSNDDEKDTLVDDGQNASVDDGQNASVDDGQTSPADDTQDTPADEPSDAPANQTQDTFTDEQSSDPVNQLQ